MALTDLLNIRQLFGGDRNDPGPEAYRELLVMVLARATDVDAYTDAAEVEIGTRPDGIHDRTIDTRQAVMSDVVRIVGKLRRGRATRQQCDCRDCRQDFDFHCFPLWKNIFVLPQRF